MFMPWRCSKVYALVSCKLNPFPLSMTDPKKRTWEIHTGFVQIIIIFWCAVSGVFVTSLGSGSFLSLSSMFYICILSMFYIIQVYIIHVLHLYFVNVLHHPSLHHPCFTWSMFTSSLFHICILSMFYIIQFYIIQVYIIHVLHHPCFTSVFCQCFTSFKFTSSMFYNHPCFTSSMFTSSLFTSSMFYICILPRFYIIHVLHHPCLHHPCFTSVFCQCFTSFKFTSSLFYICILQRMFPHQTILKALFALLELENAYHHVPLIWNGKLPLLYTMFSHQSILGYIVWILYSWDTCVKVLLSNYNRLYRKIAVQLTSRSNWEKRMTVKIELLLVTMLHHY